MGLGGKAEEYDAELTGLRMALLAATEFAQAHEEVRQIVLFSNNTAAASTIDDPLPRAGPRRVVLTASIRFPGC